MQTPLMMRTGHAMGVLAMLSLAGCVQGPAAPPAVAVVTPPSDGTQCYDSARVPFYQIANNTMLVDQQQAKANDTNKAVAGLGLLMVIAGAAAGGTAGRAVAAVGGITAAVGLLNSNIQVDQRYIADVSYSFSALVECRQAEAQRVRADVRARRIRLADGRERLRTLHDLMLADVDVAHQVNDALSRRNRTYGLAASEVDTQIASEANPADRQKRSVEVAQAKQTIQSNQRALTDQVAAINHAAQTITVSSIEPTQVPG